jgi:hypothetical protein
LRAENIVIVIFKTDIYTTKAETKYKPKLNKDKLSKKQDRLN